MPTGYNAYMADGIQTTIGLTRSSDEVALELMKFIAVTTGYGKGGGTATGFTGKASRTPEEYADALLQLFERCRGIIGKEKP